MVYLVIDGEQVQSLREERGISQRHSSRKPRASLRRRLRTSRKGDAVRRGGRLAWTAIISVGSATARAGCSIARRPKVASLRKPTGSVPKDMRHATAWDQAALTFTPALLPCAADQATTARSTSYPIMRLVILTALASLSRGPAAHRLRGIAHPSKWPSLWSRAYSRLFPGTRPP
jgi:hypothetical protein